jgi:hypothetical protein
MDRAGITPSYGALTVDRGGEMGPWNPQDASTGCSPMGCNKQTQTLPKMPVPEQGEG